MEQPSKSQPDNNQPVIGSQCSRPVPVPSPIIGAQCSRPELIPGKTYTRSNYPGQSLSRSWDSYSREESLGIKEERKEETTSCCFSEGSENLVNKIMQEKSDSNISLINSQELKSSKNIDQTIKILTGFMQSGFDDFEQRTGRTPTYREMREMYG